jgi:hypothetical protein
MSVPCPHCGVALPAAGAQCPECRQDPTARPFDHGPTAAAARATLTRPPAPSDDRLEYGGVRVTATAIAELDGKRALVTVKRADIQRVVLRWGRQSRRAFGLLLFGAVLLLLGLTSALLFLGAISDDGNGADIWGWGATLAIIGGWAVYDALRRGFFLEIDGPPAGRRLCFRRRAGRRKIDEFLTEAERRFGYQIDRDGPPVT